MKKTVCLNLSKAAFEKYLSSAKEKTTKKIKFFEECFEFISRKILRTFYCMFEEKEFHKGEVLTVQGEMVEDIYIIEHGNVGVYMSLDGSVPDFSSKKFELKGRDTVTDF